jgi:regulator of replication initiation timing
MNKPVSEGELIEIIKGLSTHNKRLRLENNIMRTAIGEAVDHIKEADEFDVTNYGEYLLQLLAKVEGDR